MQNLRIISQNEENWKSVLKKNFRYVKDLADFLEISPEDRKNLLERPHFAIQVPLRLAQKMKKGTLNDPLTRQFLPLKEEEIEASDFVDHPVCDSSFQEEGKLLKKYEGRVLLLTTGACAMHCRYCFRQNYPYEKEKTFDQEIQRIQADSSIQEVLLSGGDPLSLPDYQLEKILTALSAISHVKRIRFHTRFLVGIPERISSSFLQILSRLSQIIYIVIHTNHPLEIDEEVIRALQDLRKHGCILLNQSVLLKGVNDDCNTLKTLSEKLIDHGVLPYYLHQLDQVRGATHFFVPEEKGRELIKQLQAQLPGYAVPKYVREIPGNPSKTILT